MLSAAVVTAMCYLLKDALIEVRDANSERERERQLSRLVARFEAA